MTTSWLAPALFDEHEETELIKKFFGGQPKTFVDVGGNFPETSVSTPLEHAGWRGVVVEPQPDCAAALRAVRHTPVVECACVSQASIDGGLQSVRLWLAGPQSSVNADFISPRDRTGRHLDVPAKSLNQVLAENGIDRVDLLSLDTEGTEIEVMNGLDWGKHRPTLVLLEDHARDFVKHHYMQSKGYRLFRRSGFNSWYAQPGDALTLSPLGALQLFRKYVLGMPGRKLRRWRHQREQAQSAT